jgi:hypothetical protein
MKLHVRSRKATWMQRACMCNTLLREWRKVVTEEKDIGKVEKKANCRKLVEIETRKEIGKMRNE